MESRVRKISMALLVLATLALVAIWAVNGYEDTWFYATLILLTIPTSWVPLVRRKDR